MASVIEDFETRVTFVLKSHTVIYIINGCSHTKPVCCCILNLLFFTQTHHCSPVRNPAKMVTAPSPRQSQTTSPLLPRPLTTSTSLLLERTSWTTSIGSLSHRPRRRAAPRSNPRRTVKGHSPRRNKCPPHSFLENLPRDRENLRAKLSGSSRKTRPSTRALRLWGSLSEFVTLGRVPPPCWAAMPELCPPSPVLRV